jgi:hypothetical protein
MPVNVNVVCTRSGENFKDVEIGQKLLTVQKSKMLQTVDSCFLRNDRLMTGCFWQAFLGRLLLLPILPVSLLRKQISILFDFTDPETVDSCFRRNDRELRRVAHGVILDERNPAEPEPDLKPEVISRLQKRISDAGN